MLLNDTIDPRWAWEPFSPTSQNPWDLKKVGHLYRRAGFGATWTELEKAVRDGPEKTIDALLKGGDKQAAFEREWTERSKHVTSGGDESQMRAFWLHRILHSPHPLREKLTLFWHNHFATSNVKVNNVPYMLAQNELLRRHALGSFRAMVLEISKDPAMMVWLDTNLSKKGMPNENYARELMELFTLGIGNYTEQDVREAARAFTGWQVANVLPGAAAKFLFSESEHDDGAKTVLGKTGKWTGEDIVCICLEQKSAPYFLAGKLFRYVISETIAPAPELLEPLAAQFRKSDYDVAGLLAMMLRSNLFFSEQVYRTRVKSPVDFAAGIIHALEGNVGTIALAGALDGMGQQLFYPPSVKGWDGGKAWLNSTTLLQRQNLALALTSTQDTTFGRRTDPAALVRKYKKNADHEIVDFFVKLFLQDDLASDSRARLVEYLTKARATAYPIYWTEREKEAQRIRAVCHLVLTQPEFQLD